MLNIKHLCMLGVVVAANAIGVPGVEPPTQTEARNAAAQSAASLDAVDEEFVRQAAIGGMAWVSLGRLAVIHSTQHDVKKFAATMASEHDKLNQELTNLAEREGWELPADIDADHRAKIDGLAEKDGLEFTDAFADEMVASHRKAVDRFQQTARHSAVPALRDFARAALPTLESQLRMAQSLQREVATN